jgi:hypothetical protein
MAPHVGRCAYTLTIIGARGGISASAEKRSKVISNYKHETYGIVEVDFPLELCDPATRSGHPGWIPPGIRKDQMANTELAEFMSDNARSGMNPIARGGGT